MPSALHSDPALCRIVFQLHGVLDTQEDRIHGRLCGAWVLLSEVCAHHSDKCSFPVAPKSFPNLMRGFVFS